MTKGALFDLSKSSILYGMQCEKRLYWHVKERASATPPDAATLALMEEGKTVEAEARKRFPQGVLITAPSYHSAEALILTQAAMARGEQTLFQAAFLHEGVFVRVDILDRLPSGEWRLIEVKAGTRVQRKHLPDVAIQYWTARGADLRVKRCEVMHLNKECIHPNLDDLFVFTDVTPRLADVQKTCSALVKRFRNVLALNEVPARDMGRHCRHPTACTFEERCRKSLAIPTVSVFNIPKLETRIKWELHRKGHVQLSAVPAELLTPLQRRMVDSTVMGKRFVNHNAIARAIAAWKAPLYYLDFETISPLVPMYAGMHPGDAFPFQFSVRTLVSDQVVEKAYLHEDPSDPRPALTQALLAAIGSIGSIVTYNRSSEKGALLALANSATKPAALRLRDIASRLVDALPIMRAHVYDPAFGGSFSLKDVAPALLGLAYDHLMVGDGQAAQRAFMRLLSDECPAEEKQTLRSAMLRYCGQDTEALVRLSAWLFAQSAA